MPQLNFLPVNVSQTIDIKDESSSFESSSSDDFSQYIDLHLSKNNKAGNSHKPENDNSPAKNTMPSTGVNSETKKSDGLGGSSNTNSNSSSNTSNYTSDDVGDDTPMQKIAAAGKKDQIESDSIDQKALIESEQLLSFLTKADNTLVNQPVDSAAIVPSSEQPSPAQHSLEQKAQDEAQLVLKASALITDLSAGAKTAANDQVAVELRPTTTEQVISAAERPLSDKTKPLVISKASTILKSAVESPRDGKNKDNSQVGASADAVQSIDKKIVMSAPNIGLTTEPTTKVTTESTPIATTEAKLSNISSDKAPISQQKASQPWSSESAVDNDVVTNNEDVTLTAKQIKIAHAQVSNDKTTQDSLAKEVNKTDKLNSVNDGQATENKNINSSAGTQVSNNNQVQKDAVKSLEKTVERIDKQVSPSTEITQEKVSSLAEPPLVKNELITNREATPSSEVIKTNKEVNQAAVEIKKTVTAANQLAASAVDDNKTQAKQDEKTQLAASFAEQSQQKSIIQKEDEILVTDKVIASAKTPPSATSHFVDVSGKATQTLQQTIEQQSVEMLNPSVATEVTQSQKTNSQLHQETISLFRKDFTEAVKDKIMLMISQKLQQFDIILDPPELGNMQVRVNLQGEQAVVNFVVQSQQTKDALEQNMHKLRELLAEQGVDVGDANVEQQSQQSANKEDSSAGRNSQLAAEIENMAAADDVIAHTLSAEMVDSSTTSVDYYA